MGGVGGARAKQGQRSFCFPVLWKEPSHQLPPPAFPQDTAWSLFSSWCHKFLFWQLFPCSSSALGHKYLPEGSMGFLWHPLNASPAPGYPCVLQVGQGMLVSTRIWARHPLHIPFLNKCLDTTLRHTMGLLGFCRTRSWILIGPCGSLPDQDIL